MKRAFLVYSLGMAALSAMPVQGAAQSGKPPAETTVSGVVVGLQEVPIPKVGQGAPQYSVVELQHFEKQARNDVQKADKDRRTLTNCYMMRYDFPPQKERLQGYNLMMEASQRSAGLADAAAKATNFADQVRREAAQGKRSQKEVEDAELKRQDAVNRLVAARSDAAEGAAQARDMLEIIGEDRFRPHEWSSELLRRAAERKVTAERFNPVARESADLKVRNVQSASGADEKGSFVRVSGEIVNTRSSDIEIPTLSFMAVDSEGFPLKMEKADGTGARIKAGAVQAFNYQMRPEPLRTKTVVVTFGESWLDPWTPPIVSDPACTGQMTTIKLDPAADDPTLTMIRAQSHTPRKGFEDAVRQNRPPGSSENDF